jgi:hypothetical protein
MKRELETRGLIYLEKGSDAGEESDIREGLSDKEQALAQPRKVVQQVGYGGWRVTTP